MTAHIEKKRWEKEDIKKAAGIFLDAEKKKSVKIKIIDELVHWAILLIIVIGNLAISTFIILISPLLNDSLFYFIIAIMGLCFGFLIENSIRDIEKLSKHRHFIAIIFLPLLVLLNIYLFIGIKNVISEIYSIQFNFSTVFTGLVYGIFFLLPHIIMSFREQKR